MSSVSSAHAPHSQLPSGSRSQQLLTTRAAVDNGASVHPSDSGVIAPSVPISRNFALLAIADTVFMNKQYQHHTNPEEMMAHKNGQAKQGAIRTVYSERIPTMTKAGGLEVSISPASAPWPIQSGVKQEMLDPSWPAVGGIEPANTDAWTTPLGLAHNSLHPDYRQWQEMQSRSPLTTGSVTSTPSMVDSMSSVSNFGVPVTPSFPRSHLSPLHGDHSSLPCTDEIKVMADDLTSLKGSPVAAPAILQPYGLGAFTNMNGQIIVPGYTNSASHEGDGSLNLNGLTGDGGASGGYGDQGGFGGDEHGFTGDDQFGGGDHGNGGYGPPGGDGDGGNGGPPGGDGGDQGDGGPPPPPPRGKKLALACHFCRRRKLKSVY